MEPATDTWRRASKEVIRPQLKCEEALPCLYTLEGRGGMRWVA